MNVLFRVDGPAGMGGGHVMRCLTLARQLGREGARVGFVSSRITDDLAHRIKRAGFDHHRIDGLAANVDERGWEARRPSTAVQADDARRTLAVAKGTPVDLIVVDHYLLDASWEREAGLQAGRIAVIDDLANRPHACDFLLDQTLGREAEDYAALVPDQCRIVVGPRFALLRPEFAALRPATLLRRLGDVRCTRILVSMGASDIGGITAAVVDSLVGATDCRIDVVLGSAAPSMAAVRGAAAASDRISLHVNVDDIAALMATADVAVGTPGTSSWERCCLALPTVSLQIAENQRCVSQALCAAGAVREISRPDAAGAAVHALIHDAEMLHRMVAAAAAITDGGGAALVADALLDKPTSVSHGKIRDATPGDSATIWLWRNDPLMRAMATTSEAIGWPAHHAWFERSAQNSDIALMMYDVAGQPAAMIRFDLDGDTATVSINVNPAFRGRGIGKDALKQACRAYCDRHGGRRLIAQVRAENAASARIFEANGFEERGEAVRGFRRFERRSDVTP